MCLPGKRASSAPERGLVTCSPELHARAREVFGAEADVQVEPAFTAREWCYRGPVWDRRVAALRDAMMHGLN